MGWLPIAHFLIAIQARLKIGLSLSRAPDGGLITLFTVCPWDWLTASGSMMFSLLYSPKPNMRSGVKGRKGAFPSSWLAKLG
ncbi:unnamed protein product [Linum tenue]|uniref:Uncharacterized protein n=1 Tax=Linum tenue TaxID=586396 RepID=A0AAV0L8Q4_9ROSI|nr:unnamed protein product [Linum tenue]